MATLQQLETALINADKAGDMAAARQIAAVLKRNREDPMNQVPGTEIPETMQRQEEPGIGQQIVGAGETALALGTGATGGTIGMIGGTLKGLAEQLLSGQFGTQQAADAVEKAATGGAEALTYAPRTQAGQEQTQAVGEALAPMAALAPMTAELGAIAQGARAAAPVAPAAVRGAVRQIARREEPAPVNVEPPPVAPAPAAAAGAAAEVGAPSQYPLAGGLLRAADDRVDGTTAIVPNDGLTIVHGSGNPSLSLGDVEIVRSSGQKQGKKGRVYGGFYGTSEGDAAQASNYAAMGGGTPSLYDVAIKPGTKVLNKTGDVTRLSENYIKDLKDQGYGLVVGKDPRGQTEFVVIAKDAIDDMAPRSTAAPRAPTPAPAPAPGPAPQAGAGGARSAGAAAVEAGRLRQARANELPVPIKLTEGQRSRELGQQRFERETAKDPEMGAPIRERFEEQNAKLQQNLDEFIDRTGAEAGDLRGAGEAVDKALRARAAKDKTRIRTLYKEAEKAGDMEAPVSLDALIKHLNESAPEGTTAPLINTARNLAVKLGIASERNGELVPVVSKPTDVLRTRKPEAAVTLGRAEQLRQAINRNAGAEPTNIRQAAIMKKLIDEATESAGGRAYRKARAARVRFAKDYENVAIVKNLIGKKKGTTDRAIALEDVVRRSILDPSTSLDDVRQIRRVLNTEGDAGKQAWKELQGATLNHIKDEATKNVARDQQGNAIVSPAQLDRAIQKLDKNGKLDFVFGKKGAEMLRTVNDVAKDVLVATPGAVNTSNTASVLAGLMDVAISGTTGVPAPLMTSLRLMTKSIKDRKTRARVQKALGLHRTEEQ